MKKSSVFIGLLCFSLWAKGQSPARPVVSAHIDTIYSTLLKERRPVWVYSPSYDTTYFTKPQYPVLYVLDGDGYFASLVTMIQQLAIINENTVLPEMIIVGIPNVPGKRSRDLTPTHADDNPDSGGGEIFTSFLKEELIPYIDQHYATASYRVLMGHSLGGLMVMNTLLNHTELFSAYAALDPSMFYDRENLLRKAITLSGQQNFDGRNLFLGIGNTMNPGMDTLQVRSDTTEITHHIRAILQLKDALQKINGNQLKWVYKYYSDDDHASMPFIAAYDALRFIFRSNRFPRNQPQNQYFDPTFSAAQLRELIYAHYNLMSEERRYQVCPPEPLMNQFGYIFLQRKDYEKAGMFFELNIHYYPQSFNAYDSMGDYFLALNNKLKAIDYFKRALQLKERPDIRSKLQKLMAD